MHYKKCEICGLRSGRRSGEKRVFMSRFPTDETRCRQWVKAAGNEDLAYIPIEKLHQLKFVCRKHFRRTDFNRKGTRLKRSAIPTLLLKKAPLSDEVLQDFPLHLAKHSETIAREDASSAVVTDHVHEIHNLSSTSRSTENVVGLGNLETIAQADASSAFVNHESHNLANISRSTENQVGLGNLGNLETIAREDDSSAVVTDHVHEIHNLSSTSRSTENVVGLGNLETIAQADASSAVVIDHVHESHNLANISRSTENQVGLGNLGNLETIAREDESSAVVTDHVHEIHNLSSKSRSTENVVGLGNLETIAQADASSAVVIDHVHESHNLANISRSTENQVGLGNLGNLVESIRNEHNYCMNRKKKAQKREASPMKDSEITPRKKKLIKKVKDYKCKIKILQKENILKNIKSVALKSLIQAYIRNRGKTHGKRYTTTEKAIALAIYKKSPRTYRALKHMLSLPSARTLQTLLQQMNLEPGINQTTIEYLKKKCVKLNDKEKVCVLLFDEVALKKRLIYNPRSDKVEGYVDFGDGDRKPDIADHALVFMLQGVYKKLKQPIAYYFVKGTTSSQNLAVLIKKVVRAVSTTGYDILATVCDQGPTNVGGLSLLRSFSNTPPEENYFLVDDKKIFIMFDIPHLFKSIRNNFYQAGEVVLDGKKAKWQHLIDLEQKNRSTLHFKKITKIHVNPKYKAKMKVKLAAQILSNTVAAILKLLAERHESDGKGREILETATVIETLDKLFDCTNGPSSKEDVKRKIRENVSDKSNHLQLWREFKRKIKTMHFLKSDSSLRLKNVRCVQGYLTSLSSLEEIWKYVKAKGFKYLNLRQLNQDALENLFGMVRQHCPTNRNPTCHHFTAALKSIILTRLSTPTSRGANCEQDYNESMLDFEDFLQPVDDGKEIHSTDIDMSLPVVMPAGENTAIASSSQFMEPPTLHIIESADSEDLQLEELLFATFEKQPTVYVAGYLAYVILKKAKWHCECCKQCLEETDQEKLCSPMYDYIKLREWWSEKRSLVYPTLNLCNLVNKTTEEFDLLKDNLYEHNVSNYMISVILTKCDSLQWVCKRHTDELIKVLMCRLIHLLIRNECNRINQSFAIAEESTADVVKKAQQQGIAK